MPENLMEPCEALVNELSYRSWTLQLIQTTPLQFQLLKDDKVVFRGALQVINNDSDLAMNHFEWRFRVKENQIEQWCNLQLEHRLSVGICYSFERGALVIEYLARNSVPTRLDIRHNIELIDASHQVDTNGREFLDSCAGWQRKNHDQPSSYLIEPGATKDFRESFSATQWIVLE